MIELTIVTLPLSWPSGQEKVVLVGEVIVITEAWPSSQKDVPLGLSLISASGCAVDDRGKHH